MAVIKCKMCGGDLNIVDGESVCECEYCGTRQTIPAADNEKKLTLFARANRLRLASEFDKAFGIYESIVADFPEEAEAYWGLVLCKYGIEYVDDPATGKKIPTCHRSSFESVMDDSDFEQVMENSDPIARKVYREEAKQIEEIRKGILEVSGKEDPYDIFICYKETDENGDRTLDSVLAQDLYDVLTDKGYRVFFARITLEDKLGQEYEPYIFAALNSAKIMLAVGTDYEYYNAVWVKNEWSRYLKLMTKDKEKHLIPCYKGIDAYDMPKEFGRLQAQDLGKVGAMQDLLRGVEKLLSGAAVQDMRLGQQTVVVQAEAPGVESLLKRADMFLEERDWDNAREYFNRVLDIDPECARGYLGLCFSKWKCVDLKEVMKNGYSGFFETRDYVKAYRFFDETVRVKLDSAKNEVMRKIDERCQKWMELDRIKKENRARELQESKIRCTAIRARNKAVRNIISAGDSHTLGVKLDGTVLAVGSHFEGECKLSEWRNIIAVRAGRHFSVGLKSDGTVVANGRNSEGQCNVSDWRDIIDIAVGDYQTFGLKSDGTVIVTKFIPCKEIPLIIYYDQENFRDWHDIIAIEAAGSWFAGLMQDGSVRVAGNNISNTDRQYHWEDVVEIALGRADLVALKADGTVESSWKADGTVICAENEAMLNHITAISICNNDYEMLLENGQVMTNQPTNGRHDNPFGDMFQGMSQLLGRSQKEKIYMRDWEDIVAISAGASHTIGLKQDGTLVATQYDGDHYEGQCEIQNWKLFNSIDSIEQDRKEAMEELRTTEEKQRIEAKKRKEEEAKQREVEQRLQRHRELVEQRRSQGLCPYCGGTFKGLFKKVCSQCGKPKDY